MEDFRRHQAFTIEQVSGVKDDLDEAVTSLLDFIAELEQSISVQSDDLARSGVLVLMESMKKVFQLLSTSNSLAGRHTLAILNLEQHMFLTSMTLNIMAHLTEPSELKELSGRFLTASLNSYAKMSVLRAGNTPAKEDALKEAMNPLDEFGEYIREKYGDIDIT